ncbi:MAG: hypothetical protein DMF95_09835 [Acidobacteria bacterium]|nr:MAG: hypothetical protein DMF95_09835 [Acidobacteriota bacterium]
MTPKAPVKTDPPIKYIVDRLKDSSRIRLNPTAKLFMNKVGNCPNRTSRAETVTSLFDMFEGPPYCMYARTGSTQ